MSYVVLARKWRPLTFADLVGQEHVSRTLANAIATDRVAHAFLFTGVRGVGKTTSARILAKALNCAEGPTASPCLKCPQCLEIGDGSDVDVREIDGASYNGIDEVRRLQESLPYRPSRDRYKIYIVDEVHMLSKPAWNAFLKTLEEPPPHVKFIFATTEVDKVPITILSRCQRYDFKLIGIDAIAVRLSEVLIAEKVEADEGALRIIAREAAGSMRDAMSLLDQVIAWIGGSDERLTSEGVARVLGVASRSVLHQLGAAVVAGEPARCIEVVGELAQQGFSLSTVARDFLQYLRDLVVASVSDDPARLVSLADSELVELTELAKRANTDDLSRIYLGFSRAFDDIVRSAQPRAAFEMALVRLSRRPPLVPLDELLRKLAAMEQRLAGGGGGPSGSQQGGGQQGGGQQGNGGRTSQRGGGRPSGPRAAEMGASARPSSPNSRPAPSTPRASEAGRAENTLSGAATAPPAPPPNQSVPQAAPSQAPRTAAPPHQPAGPAAFSPPPRVQTPPPGPQSPPPQSPAPQFTAPQFTAPQSPAPPPAQQNSAPQSPTPQSPAQQNSAPQSPAPQVAAPQSPAPQSPAPQFVAPQFAAPQSPAPQTPAPQRPSPQPSAPPKPAAPAFQPPERFRGGAKKKEESPFAAPAHLREKWANKKAGVATPEQAAEPKPAAPPVAVMPLPPKAEMRVNPAQLADWEAILSAVAKEKQYISAYFQHAAPMEVRPGQVTIGFVDEFIAKQVKDNKAVVLLKKIVEAHFGQPTEITVEVGESHRGMKTVAQKLGEELKARVLAARQRVEQDPIVLAAMELLGAELRDVRLPKHLTV